MSYTLTSARDEIARRFAEACRHDTRIEAAFLGGSGGSGTADEWADIDLYLIVGDEDYDAVFADRDALLDQLGTTVLRETLDIGFDVVAFIMDNGVDGELIFHRVSGLEDLHTGRFIPLIDRAGILQRRAFPHAYPGEDDVAGELPIVLHWFWRDTLHFTRAIARGRPWTAYAFLEKMRGGCQYLIAQAGSVKAGHPDHFVPFDGYEALDHIPNSPELEMLRESLCPLEREAMVRSAHLLIGVYQRLGPALAGRYGVDYPADAATLVIQRLDALDVA